MAHQIFTVGEFNALELRIRAEHAKDLAALERIRRLVIGTPTSEGAEPSNGAIEQVGQRWLGADDPNGELLSGGTHTILASIEDIFRETSGKRTWTSLQLRAELESRGVRLIAKNPMATIGVGLKKLTDRGKVRIVRLGSGRQPNVYCWNQTPLESCEVLRPEDLEGILPSEPLTQ